MHRPISFLLLGLLLVATCGLSLFLGSRPNGIQEVIAALAGHGDAYLASVVEARIPRTVLGVVVGAALAVSGTLIQGITRNPLGEPGILGVGVGASASVVTGTAIFGALSTTTTMVFAMVGAVLAVALVLAIVRGSRSHSIVPLILAGAVVSAVLLAYINAMVLVAPQVFESYRFWVVGSLAGVELDQLQHVGIPLLLGVLLALLSARGMNALALGEDTAVSLGFRLGQTRLMAIVAAALLAAVATAIAGPISFVGLAVPHVLFAVFGEDFRWRVPAAILGGGFALVAADVLARTIIRPQELMVGIVTAFIGAPFLLIALRKGAVMK
jgi:iron complex transport system permease protein